MSDDSNADASDDSIYVAPLSNATVQTNLLVLLAFSDEYANQIEFIKPHHFDGIDREIASALLRHKERTGSVAGSSLAITLDHLIKNRDVDQKAKAYYERGRELISARHFVKDIALCVNTVDAARILTRRSEITSAVNWAASQLANSDGRFDSISDVTARLKKAMEFEMEAFDAGLRLDDVDEVRRILKSGYAEGIPTGIPMLDAVRAWPARGQLNLFVAPWKMGKSWWLINLGGQAARADLKVVHITLEMSEVEVWTRYYQNIFKLSNTPGEVTGALLHKTLDDQGRETLASISPTSFEYAHGDFIIDTKGEWVDKIHEKFFTKPVESGGKIISAARPFEKAICNIRVKGFPAYSLRMDELDAYLDTLASRDQFHPDLLIIDYPDLMDIKTGARSEYRHDLSDVYFRIKGLATRRHLAAAVASQANRDAAKAGKTSSTNIAEAIGKAQIADVIITYSANQDELKHRLAKVDVDASRHGARISVVVTQNYGWGQFCMDSAVCPPNYNALLLGLSGPADE